MPIISAKRVRAFTADELTAYVRDFPGVPTYAINHPNITSTSNTTIITHLTNRYHNKADTTRRPTSWYGPDITTISVILDPASTHYPLLTQGQHTVLRDILRRLVFAVHTRLARPDGYKSDIRALTEARAQLAALATTRPDLFRPEDASNIILTATLT